MKKYIIEVESPLVINRILHKDTDLLCKDLQDLIDALDSLEEFREEDYIENLTDEQLEKELDKRRDEEREAKESRIKYLQNEKYRILTELKELGSDNEE